MKTQTIIASIIGGSLIVVALLFSGGGTAAPASIQKFDNVSIQNEKQVINITAKGGYSPRVTEATANVPTTLKMKTQGTFDCSSALVIPSINYKKNLPPTGTTEIEIPPQPAGTTLKGLCSMGMYRFEIVFK